MDIVSLNHRQQSQEYFSPNTLYTNLSQTVSSVKQQNNESINQINKSFQNSSKNQTFEALKTNEPSVHPLVSINRSNRSVLHIKENSIDELDALFDPSKWSQRKTNVLPLIRRNLPQSFFRPPESGGTKTPKRNGYSTLHSRQGSVDQANLQNKAIFLNQQHVLLQQKLNNLNSSMHSRSASEPVSVMPNFSKQNKLQNQYNYTGVYETNHQPQTKFISQAKMPHGWQPATTQNGQPYFFNCITKQTSWTLPTEALGEETSVSSPLTTLCQNSILNSVSLSIFDKKKSQEFHLASNCSSVSSPLEMLPQPDVYQTSQNLEIINKYQHSQSLGSSTVASSIGPVSEEDRLIDFETHQAEFQSQEDFEYVLNQISMPEGWQKAHTDKGEVYFINHLTKKTFWEDPRINLIPDFIKKQQLQYKVYNPIYANIQPISNINKNPANSVYQANEDSNSVSPFSDLVQNESSSFSSSFSSSSSSINKNISDPAILSSALAAMPITDLNSLLNPVDSNMIPLLSSSQSEIKKQILQVINQKQELFKFLEDLNKQESYLRSQLNTAFESASDNDKVDLDFSVEEFENVALPMKEIGCNKRNDDLEQMSSLYTKMLIDKNGKILNNISDKNDDSGGFDSDKQVNRDLVDNPNNNTIIEEVLKVSDEFIC